MSHMVDSRFDQRGGIFLVSFPGHLKTAILKTVVRNVPKVVGYSDLTSFELHSVKAEIAQGSTQCIALYELQKIYERRQEAAFNIMGNIRALIDEGFSGKGSDGSFSARATVLAALTPGCYEDHKIEWRDTGLARRLLVSKYILKKKDRVRNAIKEDEPIRLGAGVSFVQPLDPIPMKVSELESDKLGRILGWQSEDTALLLAKKIISVMRWQFKQQHQADRAFEIFEDFSESLRPDKEAQMEIDA